MSASDNQKQPRASLRPTAAKRSHDKPATYVAHYFRYGTHYTEEFDTLDRAKKMLDNGEDYGELSTELIETPDGRISGDELHPILGKRQPGCALDKVTEVSK